MVTRIIIARHGNTFTKGQIPLRVGCRTDLPLVETERGTNVGKYLKMKTYFPSVVYAAPLKRTTETARRFSFSFYEVLPSVLPTKLVSKDN